MKKEVKLVNKVKRLLRRAKYPGFLHHFGLKKYKFYLHALCLLIKETCRLSFRRASNLLRSLGFDVLTYSALCKMRKRISLSLWKKLLEITANFNSYLVAVDSTGISRRNPSWHYIKRINAKKPVKSYIKLSAFFDTSIKKFIVLRIRAKPRHDIKDVNYLLKHRRNMRKLLGDAAYDSQSLRKKTHELRIITVIKPRKNVKRGFYRKKQMKHYLKRTYHRRSMIELGFGSLKRKYGSSTLSRIITTQRAEIYCRAILHNLSLIKQETFN
jgi:hypothetical protein